MPADGSNNEEKESAVMIIEAAKEGNLKFFENYSSSRLNDIRNARCKAGCSALHWAAGSGHVEVVHYLLEHNNIIFVADDVDLAVSDKLAQGRTPLHYACRNGHLEMVKVLVERYGANPTSLAKQGVTPLQLAVWQNHLPVCQYLVHQCHVVPSDDVNHFGCGVLHWLGIIPLHRVSDQHQLQQESQLQVESQLQSQLQSQPQPPSILPLAKWLTSQPNMNVFAPQNQGHTILHKASWGGHLDLVRFLHQTFHMYDDSTDIAGNYAADLADMQNTHRHKTIAHYLRTECSLERLHSLQVLGLIHHHHHHHHHNHSTQPKSLSTTSTTTTTTGISFTPQQIRRAYLDKAKLLHPDKQQQQQQQQQQQTTHNQCTDDCLTKNSTHHDFDTLRKAYQHLTIGQGVATKQRNPAHSINLLLQMQATTTTTTDPATTTTTTTTTSSVNDNNHLPANEDDDDNLFQARLLAVLLEYGDKGLDLSNLPKKWNQVWPNVSLNSYLQLQTQQQQKQKQKQKRKSGQLLTLIKCRAGSVVRIIRKTNNNNNNKNNKKGPIIILPKNVSRNDVLQFAQQGSSDLGHSTNKVIVSNQHETIL